MRKILGYASVLLLIFTVSSCQKDEDNTPTNPLIGLWQVEKDTYQEGQSAEQTTFYDEPDLYFIDIKNNGKWIEEEFSGADEPNIREYKYKILNDDTILCYTQNENDGFKIKYDKINNLLELTESGTKTEGQSSIAYKYVRYLVK